MARPEYIDGKHRWIKKFGLNCCQYCGIVKRRDGKNKPCPGKMADLHLRALPSKFLHHFLPRVVLTRPAINPRIMINNTRADIV